MEGDGGRGCAVRRWTIVYDPDDPQRAENMDLLATWWCGPSDVLVPLIRLVPPAVTAGCAPAMTSG